MGLYRPAERPVPLATGTKPVFNRKTNMRTFKPAQSQLSISKTGSKLPYW
ncbi:hypothetical protein [Mixta calida]